MPSIRFNPAYGDTTVVVGLADKDLVALHSDLTGFTWPVETAERPRRTPESKVNNRYCRLVESIVR